MRRLIDPTELSQGEFSWRAGNDVEDRGRRMKVIDSINGDLAATPAKKTAGRTQARATVLAQADLPGATATHNGALAVQPIAPPIENGPMVLRLEDDESVRLLVKDVLKPFGQTAFEPADPRWGVSLLASRQRIDLMLFEGGPPGMNDRLLAKMTRQHEPNLPLLFMTAHAGNAAVRSGLLGTNIALITTPFSLDVLAAESEAMRGTNANR